MLVIQPQGRSVTEALALGSSVLRVAQEQRTAVLAASIVRGPAVVVGAMQRAGRVVDMQACADAGASVLRRVTTGPAAWIGGAGVVFALGLPQVATLERDATMRTLINRNVRPFLRGFSRAGGIAHYFGREWISLRQRPAVLLGFDVTRSGAVLIEAFVGYDEPVALPDALVTVEERSVNRRQGKIVAGLLEILPDADVQTFATRVLEGFVMRANATANEFVITNDELDASAFAPITDERDPVPEGLSTWALERVPIGFVEAAVSPDEPHARRWLGGDVLAPRWLFEDIAAGIDVANIAAVAMDGAMPSDLQNVVKRLTTK